MRFVDFLNFVANSGGIIFIVFSILVFFSKEKLKQIFQRSLLEDIELLKNNLIKSQAEHAANLIPQLEQIKLDFQQKLESYKVSLIAETEAIKAKGELKKSIALRYSEIEFERLVKLEHILASKITTICSYASIKDEFKTKENTTDTLKIIAELVEASNAIEIFFAIDEISELLELRSSLLDILDNHIGPKKPSLENNPDLLAKTLEKRKIIYSKLKDKIKKLGEI